MSQHVKAPGPCISIFFYVSWRALLQLRALFWSQITTLGWAQACTAPTLCCFLSLVRGSGSSLAHARKQPSIEVAIRHCGCQKDSAVFSKQRINMPELMIMNGQCARISDWVRCSGRELGLVEDVATALSFSSPLPPPPRTQGHGSASGHGGQGRRLARQHGPELKKFPSPKAGASDWVFFFNHWD